MKDLWPSASQFWKIIPDLIAVNNPDPSHSDLKIRGKEPKTLSKRAHNPYGLESAKPDLQSRFKTPVGDIPGP